MKGPTEREFMEQVTALARLHHWRIFHVHDSRHSASGFPDLVMIHTGKSRLIVAELKVGGRTLTPDQAAWLAAFAVAGVEAFDWSPDDWGEIEAVLGNRL